jgi:hypothetical protein
MTGAVGLKPEQVRTARGHPKLVNRELTKLGVRHLREALGLPASDYKLTHRPRDDSEA